MNGKVWAQINNQHTKETKDKHKELNGGRTHWATDAMPQMLWTRYFLEAQGYGIDGNILYQDNMSAVLLDKNKKKSSTKNTKHINVRYETGDVVIKHCLTEKM